MKNPRMPAFTYLDCGGAWAVLAVALLDLVLGEEVKLLALYAVGPVVASARGRPPAVAGTGLFAAVWATVLAYHDDVLASPRAGVSLLAVAVVTAVATAAARIRQGHESGHAVMRDVAATAQDALAPTVPETAGPVHIAASYESAADAARIGGDFYEVVPVRGGVRVLMGDVQGKGLRAAGLAAALLGAFREYAAVSPSLEEVGVRMACALARRPDDERFATAVLAELTSDGRMTVLNYGHPAPLVVRAGGGVTWTEPDRPGMPLGLDALGDGRPGRHRGLLHDGDRVLFHTDGLAEARDEDGRFYPLGSHSGLLRDGPVGHCLARMREDVHRHATPCGADDSALLLMEFEGPAGAVAAPRGGGSHVPLRAAELGCDVCVVRDCPIVARLRD
ncbi:serine/threonine-protein phosphatase [Streptomyces sp. NBC_00441]|uniref:PP2C family protein-serine/threonine phosphatase n=1 Tax=Streptomyces sp. NBC_00441 TaxID=2975742 RepID=UPI002E2D2B38|nr:PP2C family protein-serine/threonine phosphatase [Streptomyces sp. NBC_00441]